MFCVASNVWNVSQSLEKCTLDGRPHLSEQFLSAPLPRSRTVLDRNHVHHRIDIQSILRPSLRTRLDLENSVGPDHEFGLAFDRHT